MCSVESDHENYGPTGLFFKPYLNATPRRIHLLAQNYESACDGSNVSGAKTPITNVTFKLTAGVDDATCSVVAGTPQLKNAKITVRWQGTNSSGHLHTVATSKARIAVPQDPAYSFLGTPGQQVWVIPQVQQDGIVWPGWNTQDTEVAARVDREVTWSLEGVRGPGAFTLFLNSDFGKPQPVFDSRKPFPQQTGVDVNTHVHGNWTFDAEGTYLLDVAMTAKLTDGSNVTDRRTLRIYAGDGDPRTAFATPAAAVPEPEGQRLELWWFVAGAAVLVLATTGFVVVRRRP